MSSSSIRSHAHSDGTGLPEHAEPSSTNRWRLLTAKFSSGERFPMLLDSFGMPDWNSTIFITTQARNAAKTPNTSIAILSSIRILLTWTEYRELALSERFQNCQFLTLPELESLRDFAQSRAATIDAPSIPRTETSKTKKPRGFESARAGLGAARKCVQNQSLHIRLTYIARYLRWFALQSVESCEAQATEDVRSRITSMVETLRELRPRIHSQSGIKRGLLPEAISCLLKLIDPASLQNPFERSVRMRNYLIVCLLGSTGMRGGELLGLKVTDFDFQRNEILIARRHGDPTDSRSNQPVAKTKDRRLPLHGFLSDAVFDYVLNVRNAFPDAKRHAFLLITHQEGRYQGRPLSKAGLEKVFAKIQWGRR
jgi:integrase